MVVGTKLCYHLSNSTCYNHYPGRQQGIPNIGTHCAWCSTEPSIISPMQMGILECQTHSNRLACTSQARNLWATTDYEGNMVWQCYGPLRISMKWGHWPGHWWVRALCFLTYMLMKKLMHGITTSQVAQSWVLNSSHGTILLVLASDVV